MTTTTWAVLRDRDAALYLTGVVISGFGTSALWLVAGVWVKDLTGSDGLAALCLLAMWTPVLAGPLLGALADRFPRRPLLIGSSLFLAALLPVLVTVDSPGLVWLVLAVLFVYGATGIVNDAAEAALVAVTLPPTLLGDFNGLRMAITEGMKLVSPLAGAGLYTLYGGPAVVLLDAGTFVLAAGVYAGLRGRAASAGVSDGNRDGAGVKFPAPEAAEGSTRRGRSKTADNGTQLPASISTRTNPAPLRHRLRRLLAPASAGVRHLWAHPRLRPLVLAGGVTMLGAGLNGAMTYAVIDGLGHSPAFAGALYAVQGAGSVSVGLLSGRALRLLGERRFAAWGITVTAVAVALRAVPIDTLAFACSAAIGAGLPCVLIATLTTVQRETPDAVLGSTIATANTLVYAPNVLGLAAGATLVELADYRAVLTITGATWLATALPLLRGGADGWAKGWGRTSTTGRRE
ncbi:MFS transporter [Streptomyces roseirectus]|uniref:MFS transporter n=1 Tax=Streptomyces roseirectus TaxID=2768066 RepID=A0A7H0IKW0_9ACTN|nr:MFS transporter [Streptomyces roseirectus]QNP73426.1 MFS transporter [Streptomyces roseirectus]